MTDEPKELVWERIPSKLASGAGTGPVSDAWRAKVQGGWLYAVAAGGHVSPTFVPDQKS